MAAGRFEELGGRNAYKVDFVFTGSWGQEGLVQVRGHGRMVSKFVQQRA